MESSKKKILIVEDEAITAMNEELLLRREYEVMTALTGKDAIELVNDNRGAVDLILMDIDLGKGMDGTQAALEILKDNEIPILFLSSHTEKEIVDRTEKITSYGYVVKNSGDVVLLASIKMAFKLHEANKNIVSKKMEIEAANEELQSIIEELEQTNKELACSEQALKESEVRYRLLADNTSDQVWLTDMDLKTRYASPSVIRRRGFPLEEWNDIPLERQMTPDSHRRSVEILAEALSPENLGSPNPRVNYSLETEIYRKDGSAFWIESALTLILDGSGKPVSILWCGRDITYRKKMEEALRISEEKYLKAFRSCPIALTLARVGDGVLVEANSAFERITGYSPEEAIGKTGRELNLYPYPHERERYIERLLNDKQMRDMEMHLRNKSGESHTVQTSAELITIGNSDYILAATDDITDRVRTEKINRARLRLLEFAESHSMDETLTAALDEIEALTGSVIGFYHFLEPDQRTLTLQNWSTNTLKNMCTAEGKGSHYDVAQAGVWVDCVHERSPVIHNDYASLPHRKGMPEGHAPVVREAVVPIFRGNLIKSIIGVGNKSEYYSEDDTAIISQLGDLSWDIVERKRAEEALRDSEALYHSIYENSFDAIMLTVPDGAILAANPAACRMLGRTEDEICRLGRSGIVDTADPRLPAALAERARTGRFRAELTFIRKDGTRFPGDVASTIFIDKDGSERTSMIIRDITERKQNEEKIIAALSDKEMLLRELQHRVKNSLTLITSLISLERDRSHGAESQSVLDNLKGRVLSMVNLYEFLFRTGDVTRVNLDAYIASVIQSLVTAYVFDSSAIKIREKLEPVVVSAKNALPWGLIVNELLTNALKYAFPKGAGGWVRIELGMADGSIRLAVCDNGIGLPVDFSLERPQGFGMIIVKTLTLQLNGTVSLERVPETRFTVSVPVNAEQS